MIKSHCESDTEWPDGSLANRNHNLNRCRLNFCFCVLYSLFVWMVLKHHLQTRGPKQNKRTIKSRKPEETLTLQGGLTSLPLTARCFYWQFDGNYTNPVG